MPTEISGSTGVNKIQDNTIVNADINSSAAIAGSKLVMPTGSVLQVVSAASASEETTTSSSYQESGVLTVNITPASTSNKFWIVASFEGYNGTASGVSCYSIFRLISGGADTNLGGTLGMGHYRMNHINNEGTIAMNYLDSPSTTTALTYRVKLKALSGTAYLNKGAGESKGSITVMEIAG